MVKLYEFWKQIKGITENLNDEDFQSDWKDELIDKYKKSYVKYGSTELEQ